MQWEQLRFHQGKASVSTRWLIAVVVGEEISKDESFSHEETKKNWATIWFS